VYTLLPDGILSGKQCCRAALDALLSWDTADTVLYRSMGIFSSAALSIKSSAPNRIACDCFGAGG